MNVERWQKIKSIFNDAADLTDSERRDFLDEACGGNQGLRDEVEKMLRFADEEDAFDAGAFKFINNQPEKIPERIGKYKVIKEIGRGGMGAVYEAVFETADFSHRVAVKVIKRGMDTDQIVRRFRHEQKILASLVHPNIAQFLDGGMTADNLPFYAMEFVEGRFIDDFCREENLSLNEKIGLFRQICAAVQYAHQNLIVHRDLKPKNILVNADGTPKLLDFGIGKILSPDADTIEAGTATQLGMMTPAYASPEQVRGKRIGTTSDVYSLGVILYELLTGVKPYQISANSQLEIERAVCESEPLRPSAALGNSRFQIADSRFDEPNPQSKIQNPKLLRGDLDNIILKCLRKEPAQRYASVQEFSEDLRRYMNGLPVMARPHTFSYRAAKFVSRNRAGVVAAAVVFLSLCIGITATIWQAHRAEQQRALAEKRFADVRQLANNVVFKYHDAIADLPGATAAREMLVSDAVAYLDRLAQETTDDVELQKELALAFLKMGDVQGKVYTANVGDTGGALHSYQKAVELFEAVVQANPTDTKAKDDLIQAYDNLAFLLLRMGGGEEPRVLVEKALRLYEQIPKSESSNRERTLKLIDLYIRFGDTNNGNRIEAIAARQKAVPLIEEISKLGASDFDIAKATAKIYQRLGTDYFWLGTQAERRGEIEVAKKHFAQSLFHQEKSHAAVDQMMKLAPERLDSRRYQAAALGNSAESLAVNNRTDEALQMAEKFLATVEKTLRDDPKNQETQLNLSNAYEVFANVYLRRGDDVQVINYTQKALEVDEAIYQADKQNREVLFRIKERYSLLAKTFEKLGDKEKADFHRRKLESLNS